MQKILGCALYAGARYRPENTVIILLNKKQVSHTQSLFSTMLMVINNEVMEAVIQNYGIEKHYNRLCAECFYLHVYNYK
jgi:hypothetical protein